MTDRKNNGGRGGPGKHRQDVPRMTEAQKQALCEVPVEDLYNDPRSLVQIWRDAGIHYQEHVMPPPTAPRAHHHQRHKTDGSQCSSSVISSNSGSGSVPPSTSRALVPMGSSPPFSNNHPANYANRNYSNGNHNNVNHNGGNYNGGSYANGTYVTGDYGNDTSTGNHGNGNYTTGNHVNDNGVTPYANDSHFSTGAYGQAPYGFAAVQQHQQYQQEIARPTSRLGNPATAYFVPAQSRANTMGTQPGNTQGFRVNGRDSRANQASEFGNRLAQLSDAELDVVLRRLMSPPSSAANEQNDRDSQNGGGGGGGGGLPHRRGGYPY